MKKINKIDNFIKVVNAFIVFANIFDKKNPLLKGSITIARSKDIKINALQFYKELREIKRALKKKAKRLRLQHDIRFIEVKNKINGLIDKIQLIIYNYNIKLNQIKKTKKGELHEII